MFIARTRCGRTVAATRSATVIVATLLAFSGCLDTTGP